MLGTFSLNIISKSEERFVEQIEREIVVDLVHGEVFPREGRRPTDCEVARVNLKCPCGTMACFFFDEKDNNYRERIEIN